jgi:hypothetical protein
MPKRNAVLPQALNAGQVLAAVLRQLWGLVRWRIPLLIGQDHQNVRATSHRATLTAAPRARVVQIG